MPKDKTKPMTLENLANMVAVSFDGVYKRFDSVDRRLDGVDKRLDTVEHELGDVKQRLIKVEFQVDEVHDILKSFEVRALASQIQK